MFKVAILGCENSHADGFLKYIKTKKEYSDVEVVGIYSDEIDAAKKLCAEKGVTVCDCYAKWKRMAEVGIDISTHTPKSVEEYLNEPWDYVVTVCGGARESCPVFVGEVGEHRHIGFDDPSEAQGAEDYVMSEFHRVRDAIAVAFKQFGEEISSNC